MKRKYHNSFCVTVTKSHGCNNEGSFEGAIGCNFSKSPAACVALGMLVDIYNTKTYRPKQRLSVRTKKNEHLFDSETHILHLAVSHDEAKIGVVLGR